MSAKTLEDSGVVFLICRNRTGGRTFLTASGGWANDHKHAERFLDEESAFKRLGGREGLVRKYAVERGNIMYPL